MLKNATFDVVCGGLGRFAVVCGGLWWFAVVCGNSTVPVKYKRWNFVEQYVW